MLLGWAGKSNTKVSEVGYIVVDLVMATLFGGPYV